MSGGLKKRHIAKARRRVRMRSALLLTLGVTFVMMNYRVLMSLNSMASWRSIFGNVEEAALCALCFGGASYLGLCVLDGDHRKILPMRRLSRAQVRYLCLTGALLICPVTLMTDVIDTLCGGWMNPPAFAIFPPGDFLMTLLKSAVIAPVFEELFFRGYLMHALERFGRRRALLVSAMCFALAHPGGKGGSGWEWPLYTLLGLFFGALVQRTGSLTAGMLLHGAYNMALVLVGESGLYALSGGLTLHSCAVRLMGCAMFVYALKRAYTARRAGGEVVVWPQGEEGKLTRREKALLIAAGASLLLVKLFGG